MRSLIYGVLSAALALGAASPALAARNAQQAADEVRYTDALNTLSGYAASHRYSDLSNVTRRGDRIEATAVRDGKPVKLSIDVTSGEVQEHQG
jgi:hypothetical protein